MAKVAKAVAPTSLPSDSLPFPGGGASMTMTTSRPAVKRKTPSELRGEILKRRFAMEHVKGSNSQFPDAFLDDSGVKKPDGPRNTKYVGKRLDEVYPARKPTSRLGLRAKNLIVKESQSSVEKGGLKSSLSTQVTLKSHQNINSKKTEVARATHDVSEKLQGVDKESQNTFRSVAELSLGTDRFSQQRTVDVDKAWKGMAAREASGSCSPPSSTGNSADAISKPLSKFCSEISIPGRKVPLDFTLKTTMRIVSTSPVDRLHRLLMRGNHNGMMQSSFPFCCSSNQSASSVLNSPATPDPCSLHSWIYPQSLLPASIISVLSSSSGEAELDFLSKRQLAWEDSFRSLYYLLRKNGCSVFYVCTSQFVVMFAAVDGVGKGKRTCNAYISQSTRGLRSLLREHDICYSMPFCCTEVEQISREDLVELSEIEKHNLGQAKRLGSMPDVDNSPKSLLAFSGNDNVHGLYDFLLNNRSSLTMLSGSDVPVLCAPIPFLNAAISSPEIKCKEIKRADGLQSQGLPNKDGRSIDGSMGSVCYSIEIKDAYLPPWIICSICSSMGSERGFEASFVTEPNSVGLNAALEVVTQKTHNDGTSGESQKSSYTFGILAAVVTSELRSASLKGLKYLDGSYVASLSPVGS